MVCFLQLQRIKPAAAAAIVPATQRLPIVNRTQATRPRF